MDYKTALDLSHEAQALDPREAVCGYYGGGSFVLDSVGAFLWFKTKLAMLESIGEVEPAIYEVAEEDRLLYNDRVIKLLEGVGLEQLNGDLLNQINEAAKKFLLIGWWGNFEDLTTGESEYAKQVRMDFHEQTKDLEDDSHIMETEMDDFISFIKEYGF